MRFQLFICTCFAAIAGLGITQPAMANSTGDCNGPDHNAVGSKRGYIINLNQEGVIKKVGLYTHPPGFNAKKNRYDLFVLRHGIVARTKKPPHKHRIHFDAYGCSGGAFYADYPPRRAIGRGAKVVAMRPKLVARSDIRVSDPKKPGWKLGFWQTPLLAAAGTSRPGEPRLVPLKLWTRQGSVNVRAVARTWDNQTAKVPRNTFKAVVKCDHRRTTVNLTATLRLARTCTVGPYATAYAFNTGRWRLSSTSPASKFRVQTGRNNITFVFKHLPPQQKVMLRVRTCKWTPTGCSKVQLPAKKYKYRLHINSVLVPRVIRSPRGGHNKYVRSVEALQLVKLCQLTPKKGSFFYFYRPKNRCEQRVGPPGQRRLQFTYVNKCAKKHINQATGNCRRR